ncbi:unnamed protein product [Amoebophrya sp. A120]|nr:unnamed protein product [Amoebophrya sp. A120]|eukprot:GSA120T00019855001.1
MQDQSPTSLARQLHGWRRRGRLFLQPRARTARALGDDSARRERPACLPCVGRPPAPLVSVSPRGRRGVSGLASFVAPVPKSHFVTVVQEGMSFGLAKHGAEFPEDRENLPGVERAPEALARHAKGRSRLGAACGPAGRQPAPAPPAWCLPRGTRPRPGWNLSSGRGVACLLGARPALPIHPRERGASARNRRRPAGSEADFDEVDSHRHNALARCWCCEQHFRSSATCRRDDES